MARKKRNENSGQDYIVSDSRDGVGSIGRRKHIIIPAFDEPDAYRFTSRIRQGAMSAEVFCRNPKRRQELGLPVIRSEVD